jgi:hypothetical protein
MFYSGVVQRSERVAYNRLMEGSIPPPRICEENKMDFDQKLGNAMVNLTIDIAQMTDEIKELKKEIIRLKSLNRRAADEIRELDNTLIDFIEGNAFPPVSKTDFVGFSSINLLDRLDGRTKGGYVENYEDLHLEMKAIDGE